MEAAALSRRDRERLARRTDILAAARAVFAEHGYEQATLDEIAERAEFGKGTLYNYFPDGKEELFFTLFEEVVVDGIRRVIDASFPDAEPLDTPQAARNAFHGLIEGLLTHFEVNRESMMIFMKEGHRMVVSADRNEAAALHWLGIMEAVQRPVEAAMAHGALRALPAHPIAHLIMSNVRGVIMAEVDAECDPSGTFEARPLGSPTETADFITSVLFDGLLPRD
ncbi:MAG: helix-turn-helix domain-containing protein [Bacteroidota bacterium]